MNKMPGDDQKDRELKVLEMVREVVKFDEDLRTKYKVGDKFRFVRERLHDLLSNLEKGVHSAQVIAKKSIRELSADEVPVFVYLYNAHGANIRSWQKMLTPDVFYEYSVNRPIYSDKSHIEGLLRSKSSKSQHGYLTIAVNPQDVISSAASQKDAVGNPLIRVREGSLRFDALIQFTHNEHEYTVNEQGELTKKS